METLEVCCISEGCELSVTENGAVRCALCTIRLVEVRLSTTSRRAKQCNNYFALAILKLLLSVTTCYSD